MSPIDHPGAHASGDESITTSPPGLGKWKWPALLWVGIAFLLAGLWSKGNHPWIGLSISILCMSLVSTIWQKMRDRRRARKGGRPDNAEPAAGS